MAATQSTLTSATMAGRAGGAMFLACFGGLWLEVGAWRSGAGVAAMAAIACAWLALSATAWLRYRRHAPALVQVRDNPEQRRTKRIFHTVNGVQWFVIVLLGNVLANIGLGSWVVPMAIFVIGLHFLPLAVLFRNRAHYATAFALAGFAVLYPLLSANGPRDPIGFYGTGLVLWLSAAWALRPASVASGAAVVS